MTFEELLLDQDCEVTLNSFLSDESQEVYTNKKSTTFIKLDLPAEGFIASSKFGKFKKGNCIECGEKLEKYSDIYTATRNTEVKYISVFGFKTGHCQKCAKSHESNENFRTHAFDDFEMERVPGEKDKLVTRYFSKGWDRSIDPIYDIDCEKVEGLETVSAELLKWEGRNN